MKELERHKQNKSPHAFNIENDEEKMRQLALYDTLTGLPNRSYFNDILRQSLNYASAQQHTFALMFIDLDRFKKINDKYGHAVGDAYLKIISGRINHVIRKGTSVGRNDFIDWQDGFVGRFGGDEFTILLHNVSSSIDVAKIARRIIEVISQPITIESHEFQASLSIGISFFPNDGIDAETLLKNADIAMYHAKNRCLNNYEFYSQAMNTRVLERFNLENSLQRALEKNEFIAYYQPKIDIKSGAVTCVETFIRWQHPDLGLILPNEFISLAEETGIIKEIGVRMIELSCRQMKYWSANNIAINRIAVNLASQQIVDDKFIEQVSRILNDNQLRAEQLELEVTESIFLEDTEQVSKKLSLLKDLGVIIALDDFGSGCSSLNYLKKLRIDILKIDKSFVKELSESADSKMIIKTIIAMAKCLKLRVTAEGVETEAQLKLLKKLGCHEAQGYYFCLPQEAASVEKTVRNCQKQALLCHSGRPLSFRRKPESIVKSRSN